MAGDQKYIYIYTSLGIWRLREFLLCSFSSLFFFSSGFTCFFSGLLFISPPLRAQQTRGEGIIMAWTDGWMDGWLLLLRAPYTTLHHIHTISLYLSLLQHHIMAGNQLYMIAYHFFWRCVCSLAPSWSSSLSISSRREGVQINAVFLFFPFSSL